jgi:alanyl-tRNA synthetase
VTGEGALAAVEKLEDELDKTAGVLKAQKDSVAAAAEALQKQVRELQKELESLKSKMTAGQADEMLADAETKNGVAVLAVYRSEMNADALKSLGDSLKEKLGESVVILAGGTDSLSIVVMATDGAVKKGVHAGKIIKTAMNIVDGRGGGRPNMAQGGGKNAARVQEALAAAKEEAAAEIQ